MVRIVFLVGKGSRPYLHKKGKIGASLRFRLLKKGRQEPQTPIKQISIQCIPTPPTNPISQASSIIFKVENLI
jgi:hypothetical protein